MGIYNLSRNQSENYIVPPRELGVGIYKNPRNYNTLRFLAVVLLAIGFIFAGGPPARANGKSCKCSSVGFGGSLTLTEDHCAPDTAQCTAGERDNCKCVPSASPPGDTEPGCTWVMGGTSYPGVETGLGCIPVEPEGLVFWGLRFIIGISGGIALLLLLFGGIKYITSQGDPKALQDASSTMTSALGGFLLIILSVLILRIIGYEIFRLPGWGVDGGKLTLPGG